MTYRSIKEWPEGERPRERLLRNGPGSLTDAHLIAIILRTGWGGKSAIDLGMELLSTFGSLERIAQASTAEICAHSGLGKAKAAQIKAALELARRLSRHRESGGIPFSTGRDVYDYFAPKFRGLKKELFYCAMLDTKNRLIRDILVTEGTLTATLVHPREAYREAIREAAAAVIFVHNHPSGDAAPSREDILITEKLAGAGEIVGIRMLDHIIIGGEGFTSMLEKGYTPGK